jgi:O-antigen ligase
VTIVKMIGGTPLEELMSKRFYYIHHTYVALYISIAMAFAATELVRLLTDKKDKTKHKTRAIVLLAVGELMLTLFAMAINSRAGILAIILIGLATLGYLTWTTRNWRLVLATTALVAVCATGLYFLQPESRHRLTKTVENISGDVPKDERLTQARLAIETAKYNMEGWQWLFGLGEGDMKEYLYERYAAHGYKFGLTGGGARTHNQYLDTFLGCGFVGLAVLLLMLLLPLRHNRRQQKYDRLVVPSVVLPTLLILVTEMMLVRQAGIVFIAFSYYILILWKTKTSHS